MHTTIMPLTIQGQATQTTPARWRAWVKALRALAATRGRSGLDLLLLECIAVALFALLAGTLVISVLPIR